MPELLVEIAARIGRARIQPLRCFGQWRDRAEFGCPAICRHGAFEVSLTTQQLAKTYRSMAITCSCKPAQFIGIIHS